MSTNRIVLILLLTLSLFPVGCVSKRSPLAKVLGYEKTSEVQAGPYQLLYGKTGTNEYVLLYRGNHDIMSIDEDGTRSIFRDGLPFIDFKQNPDGSLTNLAMEVPDKDGKRGNTMIDKNVDGQWDIKIDRSQPTTRGYFWEEGHWVEKGNPQDSGTNSTPP